MCSETASPERTTSLAEMQNRASVHRSAACVCIHAWCRARGFDKPTGTGLPDTIWKPGAWWKQRDSTSPILRENLERNTCLFPGAGHIQVWLLTVDGTHPSLRPVAVNTATSIDQHVIFKGFNLTRTRSFKVTRPWLFDPDPAQFGLDRLSFIRSGSEEIQVCWQPQPFPN